MSGPHDYPVVSLSIAFVVSTVCGSTLTYLVRNFARRKGWVSAPASHHIHSGGIPRIGGVAIYLTFMSLFFVGALTGLNPIWRREIPIIAAATLLFAVGLADDFKSVSAQVKLAFEIIAGAVLYFGGVHLLSPNAFHISLGRFQAGPLASLLATIIWVVLITNALNLIDGLDGLAAGAALFAIVTLFGLALAGYDGGVVFSTLLLGGAVLGFLRYNFNPATVFLGDGGSLFVGGMLSGLALQPSRSAAPTFVAVAIPLVTFALPVLEVVISVVRRFLSGRPLFAPDQEHIHHRLLQLGLTHRQAVIVLYGVCAGCALLSLFLLYPGRELVGLVLVVAGTIMCFGIQRLGYPEFNELGRVAYRTFEQKKVIANNVMIRKTAHALQKSRSATDVANALDRLLRTGEFDHYELVSANFAFASEWCNGKVVKVEHEQCSAFAGWSLSIDLHNRGTGPIGRFVLARAFRRRSVLVDVNLLFSEVEPALSSACQRIGENGGRGSTVREAAVLVEATGSTDIKVLQFTS